MAKVIYGGYGPESYAGSVLELVERREKELAEERVLKLGTQAIEETVNVAPVTEDSEIVPKSLNDSEAHPS